MMLFVMHKKVCINTITIVWCILALQLVPYNANRLALKQVGRYCNPLPMYMNNNVWQPKV